MQNYFGGNTDRQQFENDKENVDVAPPPGKILRTPMNDLAFSLSLFLYFRAFPHYQWHN